MAATTAGLFSNSAGSIKGGEAPGVKFDANSAAAALVLSNNLERKQTQAQNSHIINVNSLLKEEMAAAGGE